MQHSPGQRHAVYVILIIFLDNFQLKDCRFVLALVLIHLKNISLPSTVENTQCPLSSFRGHLFFNDFPTWKSGVGGCGQDILAFDSLS